MQKFILIRHAKALSRNKAEAKNISDKNRPLTTSGIKQFKKFIKLKKNKQNKINLFVSSPYKRAIETLDIILDVKNIDAAPIKIFSKITPEDNPKHLLAWLKKRTEKLILIVSHEPFMSNFLNQSLDSEKWTKKIKKGGIVEIGYYSKNQKFKLIAFNNPSSRD